LQDFCSIIHSVRNSTGCHVLFVLDEADVLASEEFITVEEAKHYDVLRTPIEAGLKNAYSHTSPRTVEIARANAERSYLFLKHLAHPIRPGTLDNIATGLRALVINEAAAILMAHEWGDMDWDRFYGASIYNRMTNILSKSANAFSSVVKPRFHRIELMPEQEIASFLSKGTLQYTELAKRAVWRFTGGYPALAQLLCYFLIKQANERRIKEPTVNHGYVTSADIKCAISDINSSADWAPFIDYLRYGFTLGELRLLVTLTHHGFVDPITGRLLGIELARDRWSGLEPAFRRFEQDYPDLQNKQWVSLHVLGILMMRLKAKQVFEIPRDENGIVYWRIGWLYCLMRQMAPSVIELAKRTETTGMN
jgi:hypothetical protein